MSRYKSSYFVALLLAGAALTSIYLINFRSKSNRSSCDEKAEEIRNILEKDDTLNFIIKSGSLQLLSDYCVTDLKQQHDEMSYETFEILRSECLKNKPTQESMKARRGRISRSNMDAITKYRRFQRDQNGKDLPRSPINVKIDEEMNEVIEFEEESPPKYINK